MTELADATQSIDIIPINLHTRVKNTREQPSWFYVNKNTICNFTFLFQVIYYLRNFVNRLLMTKCHN